MCSLYGFVLLLVMRVMSEETKERQNKSYSILMMTVTGRFDENTQIYNNISQLKQEDPLNLSILLRGGKETNKDSPSNGE